MSATKYFAKKRFGQNFLVDEYIINRIVDIINPKDDQLIVEIGPGLGALTKVILAVIPTLQAIEIDRDLITKLTSLFKERLIIHNTDALKFDYNYFSKPFRLIGNLPYNISTPLLFHLAKFSQIVDMHFMLQKEVVERICASANNHDYGRLSVMLQYRFNCQKMLDVGKEAFSPMPKVESAIVKLTPKPFAEYANIDENKLNLVVTSAFNNRRKTIRNSLAALFTAETLHTLKIDPKKRAENITINEYLSLARLL